MSSPKLRFKEFSGNWNKNVIGSVISNKSKKFDPTKSKEDYPCIELEHLSQQTGYILGYCSAKEQKSIKNYFDEGTVLFGKLRPYLKKYALPNFKGVCSSEIWVLSSKILSPEYLFQYIQNKSFLELALIQSGSKMPRAEWDIIADGDIYFPNDTEQTKIANFLTTVDKKISQLNEQHQLMIQYKKGVMQKVFSQEIRFKDDNGKEFEKWKICTLSQLAYSYTGLSGKNKDDFGSGFAYITYKQIFDNRKIDLSKVEFVEISNDEKQNKVKINDLFFTTSSETPDEVAFCSVLLDEFDSPIYLNSFCFGVRPKNQNELNSVYASFYFKSDSFRKKILHLAQGSTRYNISKKEFMEIEFLLPCIEEQVKIANYLSVLDQNIEILAKQIEHAKAWKKGLLQQMFV